jgi:hypothetical protein
VAQSVELTLDASAEAAVVAQWDRLAAAGVAKRGARIQKGIIGPISPCTLPTRSQNLLSHSYPRSLPVSI